MTCLGNNSGVITLDVGGTSIKSSIVCGSARVLESSIEIYDSKANESSSVILNHFCIIIDQQLHRAKELSIDIVGIGLAFPGPFDYDQGVCLIKGLHKYESIYGVNLREYFANAIGFSNSRIIFQNDADAFALGESFFGEGRSFERAIYLTLGTGVGSAFIEHGEIVNHRVPYEGRMHLVPFRNGVAEDYISRRGILRLSEELGCLGPGDDVVDIANRARTGHASSTRVFERFGQILAESLETMLDCFSPNGIVLGGQITRSADLFVPSFHATSSTIPLELKTTQNSLYSTWRGMYLRFVEQQHITDSLTKGDSDNAEN